MTQSELARAAGKLPSYVCDIERGRRAPNLTTVYLLAKSLGVDPGELLNEKPARRLIVIYVQSGVDAIPGIGGSNVCMLPKHVGTACREWCAARMPAGS